MDEMKLPTLASQDVHGLVLSEDVKERFSVKAVAHERNLDYTSW